MDDPSGDASVRPTGLTVDRRESPENVPPDEDLRFSWRIPDADWGDGQSAYRIRVARSRDSLAEGDATWDTGRVKSARSTDVPFDDPALAPDETYYWTVRVWNEAGEASTFAESASFATALGGEWDGEWIAHQPEPGDTNGYRSRWREPGSGPEWVQVDLGETREFEAVELHPAEPFDGPETPDGRTLHGRITADTYREGTVSQGPVAFGFPEGYRVEVAEDPDFADARTLVDATGDDAPGPDDFGEGDGEVSDDAYPGRSPVIHGTESASARYVRVTATDLRSYDGGDEQLREERRAWAVFALAALAVRDGDGIDLAAGGDAAVTAASSAESERWGRDRLVDGEYAATMASSSPLLRTEVTLSKPVASARAHVVGLGYGELHVDGEKAGDAVLDPGWTEYDERVLYATHEVGDLLTEGENAIGLWLGRGWFSKACRQWPAGGSPRARLHLTVEYEDGTTREVTTGGDWAAAESPIVENDVYHGETYDARRDREGWAEPGFDDGDWDAATVVEAPGGDLSPQQTDPIEVTETLEPEEITERADGYVVDFGQNQTGWVEIDVGGSGSGDEPGLRRGDEIEIRHAEILDDEGGLETTDLRTAEATDTYVASGAESAGDAYEPRFTYHGYRYVRVSGYPGDLTADDVRAKVVHTAMDRTGSFDCSNEDLVAVQRNSTWGLRTNAHSVPTDCPQRDERQGFSGDGHIAAPALHYNFDAGRFQAKWARDHGDCQSPHGYVPSKLPFGASPDMIGPSWTLSRVVVPWHCYCFDGDEGALAEQYEGMRRYVEFYHEEAAAGDGRTDADADLLGEAHTCYGDWVALENADGRVGQPTELFTNAYYYRATAVLAEAAAALGHERDADRHAERAAAVADAFNERFFDPDEATYGPGTQASDAVPLFFGMVPDEHADAVAATLAEKVREEDGGQLRTGFLGTRALLDALAEYGYDDLAYEVASQPEFPGWVYMVRQGATTAWERWDSDERVGDGMNSFNHSPFNCVSEWFYRRLAGIDVSASLPDERVVDVAPSFVDDLDWAEGSVETPWGEVASRWERTDEGHELAVDVPWNLDGRIAVPAGGDATVALNGAVVWDGDDAATAQVDARSVERDGDRVVVTVDAGSHRLAVE